MRLGAAEAARVRATREICPLWEKRLRQRRGTLKAVKAGAAFNSCLTLARHDAHVGHIGVRSIISIVQLLGAV